MKNWLQSANSCNSGEWILLIEFRYKFLTFYRNNNTCNIVLYYLNCSSFWINYLIDYTRPSLYTIIVTRPINDWIIEIDYILYRLINRDPFPPSPLQKWKTDLIFVEDGWVYTLSIKISFIYNRHYLFQMT